MVGHMPLEFTINGRMKRGYLSQDILLAKEHRGRGLGKILLKGIKEQVTSFAGAIWFNEPNYHLYQKSGWLNVNGFYPYLKIFDPSVLIKKRIKNRTILIVVSRIAKALLRIKEIPKISSEVSSLGDTRNLEIQEFNENVGLRFNFSSRKGNDSKSVEIFKKGVPDCYRGSGLL